MKFRTLLSVLLLSVGSISCVKTKTTSSGRLTLDSGFRGQLDVSHLVKTVEGEFKATKFEELAKIEACDRFEAIWL